MNYQFAVRTLSDRTVAMSEATADTLEEIAMEIVDRAEREHRDLSGYEMGRVDTLLDLAQAIGFAATLETAA